MRDRVVMMARVKDEARWIGRCLASVWPVAATVVLWDDGSTDGTGHAAVQAVPGPSRFHFDHGAVVIVESLSSDVGPCALHLLASLFTRPVAGREVERVNEIRDKNMLWAYVKVATAGDVILCLDGDEALSRRAQHVLPELIAWMVDDPVGADILVLPFVYLWDADDRQRVDAIYGWRDAERTVKRLAFPRVFSLTRSTPLDRFNQCFRWEGNPGGFHCGSIPNEAYWPRGRGNEPLRLYADAPVIHFGYRDAADRRRKYEFYNRIDPHNQTEGEYRHIIGEPNVHAPGPVELAPWEDV